MEEGVTYILKKPLYLGTFNDEIMTLDERILYNEEKLSHGLISSGDKIIAPAGLPVEIVGIYGDKVDVDINSFVLISYLRSDLEEVL